jgi:tetratricopeptide (TPR) repeat protein
MGMCNLSAELKAIPQRLGWGESVAAELAGDYTRALRTLEKANATAGLSYASCMRTAWLHYQAGGYKRSLEYYEIANLFSGSALEPMLGALDCCVAMGDLAAANEYITAIRFL